MPLISFDVFMLSLLQRNTFQGLAITDGTRSYGVFTYHCGQLEWSGLPTIGYNDYGNDFFNHDLSGSPFSQDVACSNWPFTPWSNVVVDLTAGILPTEQPTTPPGRAPDTGEPLIKDTPPK